MNSRNAGWFWRQKRRGALRRYLAIYGTAMNVAVCWAADPPALPVLPIAYPSTVFIESHWFRQPGVQFDVRLLPTAGFDQPVVIAAGGLGSVTFKCVLPEGLDCAPFGPAAIKVPTVPGGDLSVRVGVDAPAGGSPVDGSLHVSSPGYKTLTFAIKLQPKAQSDFHKALLWALAVAIPALLTFVIGLWAQRIKAHMDAMDVFYRYRYAQATSLSAFEAKYFRGLRIDGFDEKKFVAVCFGQLVEEKVLENVPRKLAKPIQKAVQKSDLAKFDRMVLKAFPEWGPDHG